MIYCSKCGAECDSYYNYCTQCGNKMVKKDVFSSTAESLADACLKLAFVMLKALAVFIFAVMVIAGVCSIIVASICIYNFATGNVLLLSEMVMIPKGISIASELALSIMGCNAGFIGILLVYSGYRMMKSVFHKSVMSRENER